MLDTVFRKGTKMQATVTNSGSYRIVSVFKCIIFDFLTAVS